MRGSIYHVLAILHEISAGGSALAGAHEFRNEGLVGRCGYFTDIDLVAGDAFFRIGLLEDQVFAVIAEISFGIVSAESELADVFKMRFLGIGEGVRKGIGH